MAGPAKRNQKVLPLHPALRFAQGSFAPPLLQGPAYKGRPWPFKPLAASMRLAPLHNGSTHPPERGGWCRLMVCASGQKMPKQFSIFQTVLQVERACHAGVIEPRGEANTARGRSDDRYLQAVRVALRITNFGVAPTCSTLPNSRLSLW